MNADCLFIDPHKNVIPLFNSGFSVAFSKSFTLKKSLLYLCWLDNATVPLNDYNNRRAESGDIEDGTDAEIE